MVSNVRRCGFLMVLLGVLLLAGCAKYKAKSAFDQAEELAAALQFDQAVEKYFLATETDPGNKTYRMKLIAARTRAAGHHVNKARQLSKEGKVEEALAEYRLARGFDPSVEIAKLEATQLEGVLKARELTEQGTTLYREKRYGEAGKILKQALGLDPQNARALELQKQLESKRQKVVMDGIELDISSSEPVTLRLKQANLKEVFGILGKLSGINFIIDEEIKDKPVTLLLEKGTFSQAMELILQMGEVGKKVLNSKTIIVYPQTKDKAKQYEDQIIQSFYLSHIDAKKAVNLLRTMLQLRKVYVHEERNALVIRDTPETIKLAEQVLRAADLENSEVLFDLEILGVQNTDSLNLGPNVTPRQIGVGFANEGSDKLIGTNLGSGLTADLTQSLNGVQTFYTLPRATYDFAKTLTDSEVLASPKIRVRNNEKAKVHIGTREPVITVTTTGDTSTDNIQYVDVGVKLDIEPNIQLNQAVQTKISLEVSQVIDRLETTNGSVALTISTTNAQSVLTLKDGVQTIIGGLFETNRKNSKETFPLLGEIPLLGKLLTNFNDSETKREILLSITPYVVKQIDVPKGDVATIWSGGEDDLMARPKFGAFAQSMVSEVDSTTPSAAPALDRTDRPTPFPALQGKSDPMPNRSEGDGPQPGDMKRETVAAEAPQAVAPGFTAENLMAMPMPGAAVKPQTSSSPVPAAATVKREPVAEAPLPAVIPATVSAPAPVAPPVTSSPVAQQTPAAPPATEPATQIQPMMSGPVGEILTLPPLPKPPPRLDFAGDTKVKAGSEFTLTAQVANIEKLYSAPLFVNYDPALLELVTVTEGDFLSQFGQVTVFSSSPNAQTGQLVIGYKQGIGGSGASGGGSLFSLKFRGKAAGNAKVELNRINFRDPAGVRLNVEPATVNIVIK